MKRQFIFLILSVLFLEAEAPRWFLEPKVDFSKVYGLGMASSISLAKKQAISDLANSLQVSVKSTFDQTKVRQNEKIQTAISQKIDLQSQIDDLMNIEPTKAQCIEENKCYVLVEISKTDLVNQIKTKIEQEKKELLTNNSPFKYLYRENLITKIQKEYALYLSLGGSKMQIPSHENKPIFNLVFNYDGDFPKSSKSILEKTIQDYLTKFGKLSSNSPWKVIVEVFVEGKNVALDISTQYEGEVIHNASVSDTQKPNITSAFFAKRLGVQAYKKMQKWGEKSY